MPDDHPRKSLAPEHPEGLRPADEGPGFVAPAVDVRPQSKARTMAPPPPLPPPSSGEVAFALPVPVEERKSQFPSAPSRESDDEAPMSEAPRTIDWDRFSSAGGRVSSSPRPSVPADPSIVGEEREAILRDLAAIGPLDERPDRGVDRPVGSRTTLARARALRYRLALIDAWDGETRSAKHDAFSHALHIDLCVDVMLLVTLADGAPGDASSPMIGAMVSALRALRPDLSRTALRDRGSSAIAKLTLVGWKSAMDSVAKAALATPPEARSLALELAALVALVPQIDEHRLGALHDLEKALSLSTGAVAPAIEAARRRMRAG
ncbi:MAG: hypothetical protein ACXVEF_11140 [Polyangiales bacterium]